MACSTCTLGNPCIEMAVGGIVVDVPAAPGTVFLLGPFTAGFISGLISITNLGDSTITISSNLGVLGEVVAHSVSIFGFYDITFIEASAIGAASSVCYDTNVGRNRKRLD